MIKVGDTVRLSLKSAARVEMLVTANWGPGVSLFWLDRNFQMQRCESFPKDLLVLVEARSTDTT